MTHKHVNSSFIASVGYDERTKTMEVHFANGSSVMHEGIAAERYNEMMSSDSVGSFYNSKIRSSSSPSTNRSVTKQMFFKR